MPWSGCEPSTPAAGGGRPGPGLRPPGPGPAPAAPSTARHPHAQPPNRPTRCSINRPRQPASERKPSSMLGPPTTTPGNASASPHPIPANLRHTLCETCLPGTGNVAKVRVYAGVPFHVLSEEGKTLHECDRSFAARYTALCVRGSASSAASRRPRSMQPARGAQQLNMMGKTGALRVSAARLEELGVHDDFGVSLPDMPLMQRNLLPSRPVAGIREKSHDVP